MRRRRPRKDQQLHSHAIPGIPTTLQPTKNGSGAANSGDAYACGEARKAHRVVATAATDYTVVAS
jgi:hypothetical protein